MNLKTYKIQFKNLSYFLNFGLLEEEQTLGQRIYLDVNVWVNPNIFTCEDDISTVFDYRKIDAVIKAVIVKKRYKLLEHLAKAIVQELFVSEEIKEAEIRIRKPSVPISEV